MSAAAERVVARCRELALISDVPGETTRTFLSPAMHAANDLVAKWMREAGLAVSMDAVGNLRGVMGSGPRVVMASHLDTVVNAGAFDGPLGVMVAVAAVEELRAVALSFAVEVIAFSEEEGVRFSTPFLGSRAVVETLDEAALGLTDAGGVSVAQAIRGYGLEVERLSEARLAKEAFAYFEVHIEQGPVLEAEGRAVAAVTAIAGQTRLRVRFEGQANHAGTTPMRLRKDALATAAEWIGLVEAEGLKVEGLVATVGAIIAEPGLGNVVPGVVTASLDVRHAVDSVRVTAVAQLLGAADDVAARRGVAMSQVLLLDQAAVGMDTRLTGLVRDAAEACGYGGGALVSGAGHDAMIVAPHVPATMLFVRTPGGVSHHPSESVSVEDVDAALKTTVEFLRRLKPETIERNNA
ncbi:allantoate amidohydrolase [Granulicella tundricola]|uniref:Amidase, hydantoinase/carbamoylase family n=1 Tax=Granulicella tundricola (strain ATCC BAA-1859 / DSM 23138 / MP5ACTX9) TaxID=1198114 RepID=E8WYY1_GRATM|nr:allantoate amidohydrolase [Granulicella tundricola]ADW69896.1 amidase, hydantoinase/carbamoylase family [Granulicella tundricola MP5ACTX9]